MQYYISIPEDKKTRSKFWKHVKNATLLTTDIILIDQDQYYTLLKLNIPIELIGVKKCL